MGAQQRSSGGGGTKRQARSGSSTGKAKAGGGGWKQKGGKSASSSSLGLLSGVTSFLSELTVDDLAVLWVLGRYILIALVALCVVAVPIVAARCWAIFFGGAARRRARLLTIMEGAAAAEAEATFSEGAATRLLASPLLARRHPLRIMVVLGSGGHTSEMLQTLQILSRGGGHNGGANSGSSSAASSLSPSASLRSSHLPLANGIDSAPRWEAHRCVYVASENDKDSADAAARFERSCQRYATVRLIPRARNVGQSYRSSVRTTLKALLSCFSLVWEERPDVILTNGPGVCIPVVFSALLIAAAYSTFPLSIVADFIFRRLFAKSSQQLQQEAQLLQAAGPSASTPLATPNTAGAPAFSPLPSPSAAAGGIMGNTAGQRAGGVIERPVIAYFESFTCVDHLSLSGRILKPIADVFTIQWPQLLRREERNSGKRGGDIDTNSKAAVGDDDGVVGDSSGVIFAGPFARFGATKPNNAVTSTTAASSIATDVTANAPPAPLPAPITFLRSEGRVALVTVGSTRFDDLVAAVPTPRMLRALAGAKVARLFIQRGRTDLDLDAVWSAAAEEAVANGDKDFIERRTTQTHTSDGECGLGEAEKGGAAADGERASSSPSPSSPLLSSPSASSSLFVREAKVLYSIEVEVFDYAPHMAATYMRRPRANVGGATASHGGGGGSLLSPAGLSRTPSRAASPANNAAVAVVGSRTVDLLISHAGAGTILEAMAAGIPTIVVPNTRLMNNHQSVFGGELARRGFLRCAVASEVAASVESIALACGGEGGESNHTDRDVTKQEVTEMNPIGESFAAPIFPFPQPNAAVVRALFDYMVGYGDAQQTAPARVF